ncbi:MAG: hypothetical protein ACE5G9_13510 [Nitrospinales bacterium]
MKRIALTTLLFFAYMTPHAFAAQISKGQSTSCIDANSIVVEVAKIPSKSDDKFGYTSNDRGSANLSVWKSANFTTVPLSLAPSDDNYTNVDSDHGLTGIGKRGNMGRAKVVLTRQPKFSRGDSIGDISGEVKFTNTGANPVTITCQ